MLSPVRMLLVSIPLFSGLIGCSHITIVRPITGTDIYMDGENTCFSPMYLKEILKIKIDKGG